MLLINCVVKTVFGMSDYSIFDKILSTTKAQVIETGLTISYTTENQGKNSCINWLKAMNLYNSNENINFKTLKSDSLAKLSKVKNSITLDDNEVYCMEFESGAIYGYIESREEDHETKVNIFIRKISGQNEIDNLYKQVSNAMSKEAENIVTNRYIKCRNKVQDIYSIQKSIRSLLITSGAENISEVTINNGYSTVAYVKQNTPIKDNGKLIDLNYAVLKGNGESYIIIATPIIDITY